MTHLSPDTFVDLLDGTRAEETVLHLATCDICRQQLAELRRTGSGVAKPAADAISIGDIEIDFKLHQARRGTVRIEFTARELDLLRYFVQHTGQVVTREQILNEVWGYEEFPTTRTIDNFVAKLRQKIETSPHGPEHILTIHGSGYKFVG